MEQNSNDKNNTEEFDSRSKTMVFNPLEEEKVNKPPVVRKAAEEVFYAEEDEEYEDEENESGGVNGILLGVVIVLLIVFIAALIWGTSVLNKMNKKEEAVPLPEAEETVEEEIEEEIEEETTAEQEGEKIKCKIFFKSESVEQEDYGYTVRVIFKDENGKYYTERLSVDSETEIKEDSDSLSYKSFINNVIEKLGDNDIEFDGVVDKEKKHIDSISYKSEILETEEEGIVLEDDEEDGGIVVE